MEKAGEILKYLLDQNSLNQAQQYNSLFNSWNEIVKDPLAAHSRVIDIELNQLLIAVDHPGWMQLFHFHERRILHELSKKHPELTIKAIRVRVEDNTISVAKISEDIDKRLKDTEYKKEESEKDIPFENILDPELRNILVNLYNKVVDKTKNEKTEKI
jgi:hypothetical protein